MRLGIIVYVVGLTEVYDLYFFLNLCIHAHTHTHTCLYLYISRKREKELENQGGEVYHLRR